MDETQPEDADAIPEEDNKGTNETELKYGTPAYIRWRKKVHHDDTIRAAIFREGTAWAIANIVQRRFPAITEKAQEKVDEIDRLDILEDVALRVYEASDEETILRILERDAFRSKWDMYPDLEDVWDRRYLASLMREEEERYALRMVQSITVEIVEERFPVLKVLAKQQVNRIKDYKSLLKFIPEITYPADEAQVRELLINLTFNG
jgi:hypothetical protein